MMMLAYVWNRLPRILYQRIGSRKLHPLSKRPDRRGQATCLWLGDIKLSHEREEYNAKENECRVGKRSKRA